MRGLEQAVLVANLGRRRHAHTAHRRRCKVGYDIAEHVFSDNYVIMLRPLDQVHGHRVGVTIVCLDIGILRRDFIEHATEKGVAAQNVRLVAACDTVSAVRRRTTSLAREFKGGAHDTLGALSCQDQSIRCHFVTQYDTVAARRIQTFGIFAHDYVVDIARMAAR
jgi:hypothetical protein